MSIHTRGQFIDFCKDVFGSYKSTNAGNNIEVVCPFCKKHKERIVGVGNYHNQKLAIETKSHVLHCWVCGYKSVNLIHILKYYYPHRLESYVEEFKNSTLLNYKDETKDVQKPVQLPEEFQLLATADLKNKMANEALNYLKGRNVASEAELWYWKFGISNKAKDCYGRIVIPSYDKYGRINYYTARSFFKNPKRAYNNAWVNRTEIIFNEINIDWTKELTVVEGPFDLINCNDNATCILGKSLTSEYLLFRRLVENNTPVVLGLDPDASRQTLAIAKRLIEFDISVRVMEYPNKDKDIGEMGRNEFRDILSSAKIFDMDYFLKSKIASIV